MKNFLVLTMFILSACASGNYEYQEYEIERVSSELQTSIVNFQATIKDLQESICRDHREYKEANCEKVIDDEIQQKICEEYENEPEYCEVYKD